MPEKGPPVLRAADVQAHRHWRFRHTRARRVKSEAAALDFVNDVGLCSTFFVFREGLPCLWEAVAGRSRPAWPRHSHHDSAVALAWRLKDALPARRAVYYGKLVGGRPCLVALDLLPAFYALVRGRQRARDYRREYEAGRLTTTARRLMDTLMGDGPQYTRDLRANTFLLGSAKTREFERAMAELQRGLWVVKTEERYEPTFSYRWDLLERWLPEAAAEGRRLSRAAALDRLLARYVSAAVFTSESLLARLFALPAPEIHATSERLVRRGVFRPPASLAGLPGHWLVADGITPRAT